MHNNVSFVKQTVVAPLNLQQIFRPAINDFGTGLVKARVFFTIFVGFRFLVFFRFLVTDAGHKIATQKPFERHKSQFIFEYHLH